MTNDKVRQDFEAWYYAEYGIKAGVFSLGTYHNRTTQRSFEAYQAGRAAERAEIREKLESDAISEGIVIVLDRHVIGGTRQFRIAAKAAITKILEVI